MEKKEEAPPYPGPPIDYGGTAVTPQPGFQPGYQPGPYPTAGPYPPGGVQYPPGGVQYPPGGVQYPAGGGQYPPGGGQYPPGGGQYPPGQAPGVYPPSAQYPAGVAPMMGQPTITTVVIHNNVTEGPGHMMCPHCQEQILTRTYPDNGLLTWLIFGGLCFIGCWPCCLIPFCVDSCKDVNHHCPKCNRLIHVYKRM